MYFKGLLPRTLIKIEKNSLENMAFTDNDVIIKKMNKIIDAKYEENDNIYLSTNNIEFTHTP